MVGHILQVPSIGIKSRGVLCLEIVLFLFGTDLIVPASGATPPKTKASIRKTKSSSDTTITPPTVAGTRLSTSAIGSGTDEGTGIIPGVLDVPTDKSDEEISWKSSDDDDDDDDEVDERSNDDASLGLNVGGEEGQDAEDDDKELYKDVNINLEGRDVQMTDVHTTQEFEDTHVTLTPVNPDGQQQSSSVSSQFVTSMLNPNPDAGIDSLFETTPRFTGDISFIPGIVERYMDQWMNEAVKIIKEKVKEQVKVQVFKILPKIEKTVNEQLEAKVLTRSSNSSKTSYVVVADLSEMELKKILIEKMERNKSIHRSDEQRNLYKALVDAYECEKIILDTYGDTVTLKRRRDDADNDEEPFVGSDRGSKRRREGKEPELTSAPKDRATKTTGKSTQGSKSHQNTASDFISDLAKQVDSRSSFNELMDTPVDFSAFLMNRLKVDTLTPELLAGPTYELMKGPCKSLVELEFFLEEVYKETTDQLDWNNPEGQRYPHNLLKTLPLIPNSRGRHVIPFDHFINNDLEYLHGGAFSLNQESARDVYSKRRIIVVTKLQIVEWHDYKHLDWITVRRDDDKLYKFKQGDFKRLCIQDIEDMLLLLVQGKLTNLTVEKRFAFNVSLRMFTRSIVIQRRV
nr:hypothetical protein [Tanacetum cinerariifolium]